MEAQLSPGYDERDGFCALPVREIQRGDLLDSLLHSVISLLLSIVTALVPRPSTVTV